MSEPSKAQTPAAGAPAAPPSQTDLDVWGSTVCRALSQTPLVDPGATPLVNVQPAGPDRIALTIWYI